MGAALKERVKQSGGYEWARFLYRQIVSEPHYPPPLLERCLYAPGSWVEKALYARGALDASSLALPRFLGIGGLQSGTTWLWANLRRHPGIYMPQAKELHYFSWRFHRSLRYYSRLLSAGAGPIAGEITTEYGNLPSRRIRFICRVMPDVRLILMIRNPADRAWSHAKQSLAFRPGRRVEDVPEATYIAHFRSRASREAGDYISILDRWLDVFPRQQMLVCFFDEISTNPRALLDGVLKHIGASPVCDWSLYTELCPPVFARNGDGETGVWTDYHPEPPTSRCREVLTQLYGDQIMALKARLGESSPASRWG